MIFIDLANILPVSDRIPRSELDFGQLVDQLSQGYDRRAAYAFDSDAGRDNNLHHALRRMGIRVKDGGHIENGKQKGVDVELSCSMLMHACRDDYDTAILVSGDADFVPAIHQIQELGKRAVVATFSECASARIMEACDECLVLDSMPIFRTKGV